MTYKVHCAKLKVDAEGLEEQPFPGELGEKVYKNVSKEAWQMWLEHQTILINEYQLNVLETEAHDFLMRELEKYLFGEGSETPEGFIEQ